MSQNTTDQFFKSTVLGHPADYSFCFHRDVGTFLILRNAFFIDIILTASFTDGGWEWTRENIIWIVCRFGLFILPCWVVILIK
jgi:POT family proton-dependent oligopeptide transporter